MLCFCSDQKNLGMSMKVKKSSLEDVRTRLALKKQEKEEKKKEYDFQERMREIQEEVTHKLSAANSVHALEIFVLSGARKP